MTTSAAPAQAAVGADISPDSSAESLRSESAVSRTLRRSGPARPSKPPVLLTMPGYDGTLAAVRSLGRHGVRITTADPDRLTKAGWSKYTSRSVRCPPVRETERFMQWLLEWGRGHEPHVLLPTCDDTAFLYSLHRDELSKHFYLSMPAVDAMHTLLNKRLLAECAKEVGLMVPQSWTPRTMADVLQIAQEARFPLLIKPTTQVLFEPRTKGLLVADRDKFVEAYQRLSQDRYGRALRHYDSSVSQPVVQEFFVGASASGIYSICGHARAGRVVDARAARKVLQWPRRLGIGVCFEAASLEPALLDKLGKLISLVGFHGTFEAEFVQDGERSLLIDFNPRFYSQMGFEVARGLPLPVMAYEDAVGASLDDEAPSTPRDGDSSIKAYVHGAAFKVLLQAQRAFGALSRDEHCKWQTWYDNHGAARVDAVADADDRVPELIDAVNIARDIGRHPLRFVNVIALNR